MYMYHDLVHNFMPAPVVRRHVHAAHSGYRLCANEVRLRHRSVPHDRHAPRARSRRRNAHHVAARPFWSLFDYSTYFLVFYVFHCWDVSTPEAAAHSQRLFQTGWFVESMLTQALIIHIIRTDRIPFLQSRPSRTMLLTSLFIMVVGVAIPMSPLGRYLGFTTLPPFYWPLLALTLVGYAVLTQGVKMWLVRRRWI